MPYNTLSEYPDWLVEKQTKKTVTSIQERDFGYAEQLTEIQTVRLAESDFDYRFHQYCIVGYMHGGSIKLHCIDMVIEDALKPIKTQLDRIEEKVDWNNCVVMYGLSNPYTLGKESTPEQVYDAVDKWCGDRP